MKSPLRPIADAIMFVALLMFIFGLVYLAHNNWHF